MSNSITWWSFSCSWSHLRWFEQNVSKAYCFEICFTCLGLTFHRQVDLAMNLIYHI